MQLPNELLLDRAELRLAQMAMEDTYSRTNLREFIIKDIGREMDQLQEDLAADLEKFANTTYSYDSKNIRMAHLRQKDMMELAAEMFIILLPIDGTVTIQKIAGALAYYLDYENFFDGVRTGAEILTVAENLGVCEIILPKESETGTLLVRSNWGLEQDTLDKIEQLQYLPPMVCPPQPVNKNHEAPHLTFNKSRLMNNTHHDEKICLDVINILQAVPLELNEKILAIEEPPKAPFELKHPSWKQRKIERAKKKNHELLVRTSNAVYEELQQYDCFYLPWECDSRLRLYDSGYHSKLQGSEYKRALIQLHNKEVIT